jgi:hypothetical protein
MVMDTRVMVIEVAIRAILNGSKIRDIRDARPNNTDGEIAAGMLSYGHNSNEKSLSDNLDDGDLQIGCQF